MIKRISIIIVSFSFISLHMSAENDYQSMLVVGRKWNFYEINAEPFSLGVTEMMEFNGRKCYKLCTLENGVPLSETARYMYEKDCKVYMWNNENEWNCKMDFGLSLGESMSTYKVLNVDTIEIKGIKRRRLMFENQSASSDFPPLCWVEGIGSPYTGPIGILGSATVPGSYYGAIVLSIYDGDECIFTLDDFTKEAYHAEPVGINAINVSNTSAPVYDLQGRRIQGEPQKGMYIRGGKKYVRK